MKKKGKTEMDLELKNKIAEKIKAGDIKMKPKHYFVMGNLLSIFGVIGLSILATFSTSVLMNILRRGQFIARFAQVSFSIKMKALLLVFPWEFLLISLGGLVLGVYLIRKFDEGYKKSFGFLMSLAIVVVIITAFAIDKAGINDRMRMQKPFGRIYEQQRDIPEFPRYLRKDGENVKGVMQPRVRRTL